MRKEIKFLSAKYKNNIDNIVSKLKRIDNFKKYPERNISSVYLDTFDLSSLYHSYEGSSKRKKFRIRWYNNDLVNKIFEIKEKNNSLITKQKYLIKDNKKIKLENINNLLDDLKQNNFFYSLVDLNNLKPILFVNYKRDYFYNDELRLTFDTNISYKGITNNLKKNIVYSRIKNIIELKFIDYDIKDIKSKLEKDNFIQNKFSKYVNAFDSLRKY